MVFDGIFWLGGGHRPNFGGSFCVKPQTTQEVCLSCLLMPVAVFTLFQTVEIYFFHTFILSLRLTIWEK